MSRLYGNAKHSSVCMNNAGVKSRSKITSTDSWVIYRPGQHAPSTQYLLIGPQITCDHILKPGDKWKLTSAVLCVTSPLAPCKGTSPLSLPTPLQN